MIGVAIVTGGEGGIGRAINRRLIVAGYTVISGDITVRRDGEGWADREPKSRLYRQHLDVTDAGSAERTAAVAIELGSLTALVNCAGILRGADLDGFDEQSIKSMLDINLLGAARMTNAAVAHMLPGAAIVNISSISGRLNDVSHIALYGGSKAALEAYTRTTGAALARRGIRMNAVAPGFIDVDMTPDMRRAAEAPGSPAARIPLGRFGSADEVAECVEFLLSPRASYVAGATLIIDGGLTGR